MKTLYLTKGGGSTDLSNYYTKAQTDALTWTESDITDLDKYTKAETAALWTGSNNRIINGDFQVFQDGDATTNPSTGDYLADRWAYIYIGAGVINSNRVESTDPDLPFRAHLEIDVTTADASIASTDLYSIDYKVEGIDIQDLGFGIGSQTNEITINFYHAHTKTGTHCVSVRNSANNRSYVAEYTQSVADTWEEATITIPVDTTGTWLTGEGVTGLELAFALAGGSLFQGTAGQWNADNDLLSSNQVNNLDNIGNKFRITNVQLVPGGVAPAFVSRPFPLELALCERYYEKSYNYGSPPGTVTALGMEVAYITLISSGAHSWGARGSFKTPKCKTPTVNAYSPSTGTAAKAYDYSAAGDINVTVSLQAHDSFRYVFTVGSAANVNAGMQWSARAEL